MSSSTDGHETNRPPYRIYAGILCAIALGRWTQLASQSAGWGAEFKSAPWPYVLILLAIVASIFSAWYCRTRMSRMLTCLVCGLVGSLSTVVLNPVVGAVIGFSVGGLLLFPISAAKRSGPVALNLCRALLGFVVFVLPAAVIGTLAGGISGWLWLDYAANDPRMWFHALMFGLPVVAGGVLTLSYQRVANRKWLNLAAGTLLFVASSFIAFPFYIHARMRSVQDSISTVRLSPVPLKEFVVGTMNPWASKPLLDRCDQIDEILKFFAVSPVLGLAVNVEFTATSTAEDIRRVSQVPFLLSIHVHENCQMTDGEFEALNTRRLTMLTCADGTQLTDAAFDSVDFSKMSNLFLHGPNFGDDVLKRLTNIPWLAVITLDETRVTAEGLKQIDTTGPLYWLRLPNTQVGDEVFSVLDRHDRLWWVDLTGTRITGNGIKNFRTDFTTLDLDDTKFDSKYLVDFLPLSGEERTPDNSLTVKRLSLAHTNFNEEHIVLLMKLRPNLEFVDLAGSGLSLAQIKQLRLKGYGLDAELLAPQNVQQLGGVDLRLHYDAQRMTADEIVAHFESLKASRKSLPGDLSLVVHNLKLTKTAFKTLESIRPQGSVVELKDSVMPDGEVKSYDYLYEVRQDYDVNNN